MIAVDVFIDISLCYPIWVGGGVVVKTLHFFYVHDNIRSERDWLEKCPFWMPALNWDRASFALFCPNFPLGEN